MWLFLAGAQYHDRVVQGCDGPFSLHFRRRPRLYRITWDVRSRRCLPESPAADSGEYEPTQPSSKNATSSSWPFPKAKSSCSYYAHHRAGCFHILPSFSPQTLLKIISIQPIRHQSLSSLPPPRSHKITVVCWILHQLPSRFALPSYPPPLKSLAFCVHSEQEGSLEPDRHE